MDDETEDTELRDPEALTARLENRDPALNRWRRIFRHPKNRRLSYARYGSAWTLM